MYKLQNISMSVLFALCFCGAIGCAEDDQPLSENPPAESGSTDELDQNRALSQLDESETAILCDQLLSKVEADTIDSMVHVGCWMAGVLMTDAGVTCHDTYDACMEEPFLNTELTCGFNGSALTTCEATVWELDACYDQLNGYYQTMAADGSCDLTVSEMAEVVSAPIPEPCQIVRDLCPDLIDSWVAETDWETTE